jgi:hypothetical protein
MILGFAPTAEKEPAAACMDFVHNVPVSWESVRCVGGNGEETRSFSYCGLNELVVYLKW